MWRCISLEELLWFQWMGAFWDSEICVETWVIEWYKGACCKDWDQSIFRAVRTANKVSHSRKQASNIQKIIHGLVWLEQRGEGNKGVSKHIRPCDVYFVGPECKILWMNRSRLRVLWGLSIGGPRMHIKQYLTSLKNKQMR